MTDRLAELSAAGVAVWLDDLSRVRLQTGSLAKLLNEQHVAGVTTNPSIFASALADATAYDDQLKDLAAQGVTVEEAVRLLTSYDVRWAAEVLRPQYDATNGVDGRVSIEVDPRSAHLTEKTQAEAKTLWWLVDRPNVYIKIPATKAGLPAITATLAEGISVNVTLIFSLERYKAVMDAFLAGIEQAKANGHDLSKIGSVASFFVSRVDTEIDKRLDKIGSDEAKALKGKAAVANAQLAYQAYEEVFATDRWKTLAAAGALPQRPLWASTGTKNPAYKDTIYVEELIAPGVVNTMPEAVIRAYEDHGDTRGDTVTGSYATAQKVMDDVAAIGVDLEDVFKVLEDEGVQKFEASWSELLEDVKVSLEAAAKGASNPSDAAK
ncbi:transaldolase [Winogradskya humida]|uniref:Transaldolase n=1 Tax=Winogradskya humida TaxID=113566 RepID=A0ABQ3ZFA6_9ACTN|nr:transaldolase [Actinoplanes humidus]GIE17263.1 transaldolase [Actinoplanes humidus]